MSTERRLPVTKFQPQAEIPQAQATDRATPMAVDGDAFDIAEALQQIQGRERKLRAQLKDAQEARAKLEVSVTSDRIAAASRIRTLEEELRLAREALSVREGQVKALGANRAQQAARDAEERRYLREQAEQAQAKHEQLVAQYDELYKYCESLLKESEKRRTLMESQLQKAMTANRAFEQRLKETDAQLATATKGQKESSAARAVLEEEVKRLQDRHQQESQSLKQVVDDTRASLEHVSKSSNRAKFETRAAEVRLDQLERALAASADAGDRARDTLAKSARTLAELHRSIRNFFETPAEHGVTPVRMKAGRLMAEQMRLEIETLRRLELNLTRLAETVTEALPKAETPNTELR